MRRMATLPGKRARNSSSADWPAGRAVADLRSAKSPPVADGAPASHSRLVRPMPHLDLLATTSTGRAMRTVPPTDPIILSVTGAQWPKRSTGKAP
jgi:hypothetical protein